ncbi:hypothetical protein [Methylomonas methanica]|uniref:Uncharacterized protein n=1 Tax=Methylomonas methanica (strain DSM 25384 / MC09) TaxID=857087 RepID=F9ZY40_METMM|nr:hypothetical protein [Methylomonas methanica]AEF99770.1 hypothetical protein Metme_1347 [Methylomonas methanica MC09]
MKKARSVPIKVALYGMDPRSYKTMELYLKGPCRGIAEVVSDADAHIDIIDADHATAGNILEACRQKVPQRPIVLLSLQNLKIENAHFVQKPVNAEQLMAVLNQLARARKTKEIAEPVTVLARPEVIIDSERKNIATPTSSAEVGKPEKKRSAFENNEGGYTAFLGTLLDIDFSDPEQLANARFDAKVHLLSYVLSAYKVACHQGCAQQLNSIWKPLLIFPDTGQIWLDADDKQLRAFAGVEQNKVFAGNISLTPVDAEAVRQGKAIDKFQDVNAFIWKLSIWTSKGRLPIAIDPNLPVVLKCWPNFTRLLLVPDAMRIASLLLKGPYTPIEVSKVLNVKPQYVFAFMSACLSLGLLSQTQRSVEATATAVPALIKTNKKQSLFSKILNKLRGD